MEERDKALNNTATQNKKKLELSVLFFAENQLSSFSWSSSVGVESKHKKKKSFFLYQNPNIFFIVCGRWFVLRFFLLLFLSLIRKSQRRGSCLCRSRGVCFFFFLSHETLAHSHRCVWTVVLPLRVIASMPRHFFGRQPP